MSRQSVHSAAPLMGLSGTGRRAGAGDDGLAASITAPSASSGELKGRNGRRPPRLGSIMTGAHHLRRAACARDGGGRRIELPDARGVRSVLTDLCARPDRWASWSICASGVSPKMFDDGFEESISRRRLRDSSGPLERRCKWHDDRTPLLREVRPRAWRGSLRRLGGQQSPYFPHK